jgi:hypothetical protein
MPSIRKRKTKAQAKPKASSKPRSKPSPRVHPSVKAAKELGLVLSPAEQHFLENSANVPTEGNPLQGRTF